MNMTKEELGIWGENYAATFLQEKGMTIEARNVKFKRYEVDIIARDGKQLVIVEVKTRNTAEIGEPWRAVTRGKQRQIIAVADHYVQTHQIENEVRFDVISIVHNSYRTHLEHIPDAFQTV